MSKPSKHPSRQLDLRDPAVRRHFADALPAVIRILDRWKLHREDQAVLLGLSSLSLRRRLQGETIDLTETQITRMSLISGIYRDLNQVFPTETADVWFSQRNDTPPFLGHTPLAYARRTGVAGLVAIRRGLEAAAHGSSQTTPENRRQASLLLQPEFDLGSD